MSDKTIEVKSITEAPGFHALKSYYMHKRLPQRTRIIAYIILASILLLVISETPFGFPFFKLIGIVGILAIAVVYSWITVEMRPLDRNMRKLVNLKQELKLEENGISVKWTGYEPAEYDWADLEYAYENDAYFFIFIEKHFALIIPKFLMKEYQSKQIHDRLEANMKLIDESTGWKYQKI